MELKQFLFILAFLSSSESIRKNRNKAGLILLHGLGADFGGFCTEFARNSIIGLGLSKNTIVRCPSAERKPVGVIPVTFVPGLQFVRSWFNFWLMPGESVQSTTPGEDKAELMAALKVVEREIEDLMDMGVPSENIVVSGLSQGGALTLWTAIYSKYKLGGFVPIVTWLPLANVAPPKDLPFYPVNMKTPILHINGGVDNIVPVWPAGRKSEAAMKKTFSDYTFKAIPFTTHVTTAPSPVTTPMIKKWLKENTNLKFKRQPFNPVNIFNPVEEIVPNFFGGWGR